MVHILGVVLPEHKSLKIALTAFYGIGHYRSSRIMASLSIHRTATVGSLTEAQRTALSQILSTFVLENDLRRQTQRHIMHYKTIGSYIGKRHAMGYPVHGQRTQTNAKTARKLNRLDRRQLSTISLQRNRHFNENTDKITEYSEQKNNDIYNFSGFEK
ncbi:unnamed protein product [Pneumocystis jirovecii]|uniref:Small ribosomal subunit protein uS13m n=1 Tax=Pneumocystis jirovecii TaxID=42068 RepID=L0PBR8_PNEJI|nr:unnamed protein product [Pneumocystis jirovecii]